MIAHDELTDAVHYLRTRFHPDFVTQWPAEEFAARLLAYLRERAAPKLLFSAENLARINRLAKQYDPNEFAWERRIADEAVEGRLYAASNPHCDRFLPVDREAFDFSAFEHEDPQALHGLNRMRWLAALGRAYWIDRDPRYFDALLREWDFFCAKVPFPGEDWLAGVHAIGPAGLRPPYGELDLFIRLTNWYWAYWLVLFAEEMTPERNAVLLARCLRHFDLVAARGINTHEHNFTSMQMEALYLWASALPEAAGMTVWKHAARNIMESSLRRAVLPDGVQWEMSPGYHLGCIRWYGTSFLLGRRNREPWAEEYGIRLRKMGDLGEALVMPDGTQLAISDTDRDRAWSGALALLKAIFPEAAFEVPVTPSYFSLWVSDGTTWEGDAVAPPQPVRVFPHAGLAIARTSRGRRASVAVLDNGPTNAGHAHKDNLNVLYEAFGRAIIADPGRWVYDNTPRRRWAISTPAHNTVWIEDEPLTGADFSGEAFAHDRWHRQVPQADDQRVTAPAVIETERYFRLEATFALFTRAADARVTRRVYLGRDEERPWLVVIDDIAGPRPHRWTESWLLPTAQPPVRTDWGWQTAYEDGTGVAIALPAGLDLRDEEQFWCIQYAVRAPARWVRCSGECAAARRAFAFVPFTGEPRVPALEEEGTRMLLRIDGEAISLG